MNALEQIQQKIDEARNKFAELKSTLVDQKGRLETARHRQNDSIMRGQEKNADGAADQINQLETKIKGTELAMQTLNKTIQELDLEKKQALKNVRLDQADQIRTEIRALFKEIYILLVDLTGKVKELSIKQGDLRRMVRTGDQHELRKQLDRFAHARILLASELPKILEGFEYNIFDKAGLPTPDSLKKSMR